MNKRNYLLTLFIFVLAFAAPGCNVIKSLRAKDSLNEGVREFNKGKYDIAEVSFKKALELDPDTPNAERFYAQAVYQQFKEMKMSPETEPKVRQEFARTVKAFDDLIAKHKDDSEIVDQALAFKADVYDYMSKVVSSNYPEEADKLKMERFQVIEQRAKSTKSNQVRASAYYALGKFHWDEAFKLTSNYQDLANCPDLAKDFDYPDKCFTVKPIPTDVADKVREHVNQSKQYFMKSIEAMPEWATAHSMLKLVLRQEIYVTPDQNAKLALIDQYKQEDAKVYQYKDSQDSALMQAK